MSGISSKQFGSSEKWISQLEKLEFERLLDRDLRSWDSYYFETLKCLILNLIKVRKNALLLDIGCQIGLLTRKLGSQIQAVGLDIDPKALKFAKSRSEACYILADARALPFADRSFDYVVGTEVLEHFIDPEWNITEMGRVLKDGGPLIVSTPNKHVLAAGSLSYGAYKELPSKLRLRAASNSKSRQNGYAQTVRNYFGHIFLFNSKELGTLLTTSGLKHVKVHKWRLIQLPLGNLPFSPTSYRRLEKMVLRIPIIQDLLCSDLLAIGTR